MVRQAALIFWKLSIIKIENNGSNNTSQTRDVEESSGFMTLFYLTINAKKHRLSWVRARHDPTILYSSAADKLEELHDDCN